MDQTVVFIHGAIAGCELFGTVIMTIIFLSMLFNQSNKGAERAPFLRLLICVAFTNISDIVSWLPWDWTDKGGLMYFVCAVTYVIPFYCITQFIIYLRHRLAEYTDLPKWIFIHAEIYGFVMTVVTLIGCLSGKLFSVVNGQYYLTDSQSLLLAGYQFAYMMFFFCVFIVAVFYRNVIGAHNSRALIIYCVIPVVVVGINMIWPEFELAVPGMALETYIVYYMLQADHERKLIEQKSEVTFRANHDALTKLQNRIAYAEKREMMGGDNVLGVVFCDVNSLKYTNDHYGHKAGDRLLMRFADCLRRCFREDDLFRMSGDEFIVLACGLPETEFDRRVKMLTEQINEGEYPIAAIGFAHGAEKDAAVLITAAEEQMYQDKKEFYRNYNIYSR